MVRVVVTRPVREARRWVNDLSAQGLDALALPLIKVGPLKDSADIVQAWQRLAGYVGVMFVSGNAVEYFFIQKPALVQVFVTNAAIKTRAWATGPGTARALMQAGVEPGMLDAPGVDAVQFDSEALWQRVGHQVGVGQRVLIVRGRDAVATATSAIGVGRDWFAERVAQAGGVADFVVSYQRSAPVWDAAKIQLARQAATDGSVWLFSSSEAVVNLVTLLPGQDWAGARALATHPRIALFARNAGFSLVEAVRPTLADVIVRLKRMDQPPTCQSDRT